MKPSLRRRRIPTNSYRQLPIEFKMLKCFGVAGGSSIFLILWTETVATDNPAEGASSFSVWAMYSTKLKGRQAGSGWTDGVSFSTQRKNGKGDKSRLPSSLQTAFFFFDSPVVTVPKKDKTTLKDAGTDRRSEQQAHTQHRQEEEEVKKDLDLPIGTATTHKTTGTQNNNSKRKRKRKRKSKERDAQKKERKKGTPAAVAT